MKVIALLSFYDERPDWLAACVASLSRCCEHVVAVDGAYRLFPQAKAHSGDIQASAIVSTAQALELGVSYHAPRTPWMGNEVEKRNHLLELGKTVAVDEEDWFLVIDADTLVSSVPSNFKLVLRESTHDVGTYWISESFEGGSGRYPARYLYRACSDLRIERTHYGYWRGEKSLWETGRLPACETDLIVEHRRHQRHPDRIKRAEEFYRLRDVYGIESMNPQPR
jgi:hypothetical protein